MGGQDKYEKPVFAAWPNDAALLADKRKKIPLILLLPDSRLMIFRNTVSGSKDIIIVLSV